MFSQPLTWPKEQWETIREQKQNRKETLVNLFVLYKDPATTLRDHWDHGQEAMVQCKLDEVNTADTSKVMAVAASTQSMREGQISAQIWEKNKSFEELQAFIEEKKSTCVEQRSRKQQSNQSKEEPIAAVTRRRNFS